MTENCPTIIEKSFFGESNLINICSLKSAKDSSSNTEKEFSS